MALFLVRETIPNNYGVFLSGWDNRNILPENVACIHHPSGDAKKISRYTGQCKPGSWAEGSMKMHWEVPYWMNGTTEPGSSGSPLFDNRGLLRGHLHGGQSSCDYLTGYDMFGAFWADWNGSQGINSVASFLNPAGKPCIAMRGRYLATIPKRAVPQVQGIMPLYKVPRPRLIGPRKDDIPLQHQQQQQNGIQNAKQGDLEKNTLVYDLNDLSDNDEDSLNDLEEVNDDENESLIIKDQNEVNIPEGIRDINVIRGLRLSERTLAALREAVQRAIRQSNANELKERCSAGINSLVSSLIDDEIVCRDPLLILK